MTPKDPASRRRSASAERVEHVDGEGHVLGIVTREEMRRRRLRHRCTYIVVLDSEDQFIVHQRAPWKDVYPGWWDIAFGGVCGVGESWHDAASRELLEEAGLRCEVNEIGTLVYDEDDGNIIGRVFLAHSDEEPTCPDGEVVMTDRVQRGRLRSWVESHRVCSDSRSGVLPLLLDQQ